MSKQQLETLESEKIQLKEQVATEEKKHQGELKGWERKIKEAEEKLDGINRELKEKEQENRISKLKIKEMRRMLKHN